MFTEKIPSWTQQLMGILAPLLPPQSYLADGTALALHLNHRSSFDLDIYSPQEFNVQMLAVRVEKELEDFNLTSIPFAS